MIPRLANPYPSDSQTLEFLEQLARSGFGGEIHTDYGNRTVQSTDNSVYQILPQAVVYPCDTDDLVALGELLSNKSHHGIHVSPRGGGTGTNGQSLNDGIIVDLSKHMNNILEINAEKKWVRVQSGVVKDQLNAALKPHGLFFAPELSTSNRATIGGMINTDASGQGSCLYGKTRDHVIELQTVLMDGSVLHSQSLSSDEFESLSEQQNRIGLIHRIVDNIQRENKTLIEKTFPKLNRCLTGYDLAHIRDEKDHVNLNNLICGSEGTLGFVTEAKLNLVSIPKTTALIIVKYNNFESSLRDATTLMQAGPSSIETIDSKVLGLAMQDIVWHQVEEYFDDDQTQELSGINLVEYSAESDEALEANMKGLLEQLHGEQTDASGRIGYSIAMGRESVNKLWGMRKKAVGLLGNAKGEARPMPFVEDTAVPPENLADFIMEFREILDAYNLEYGMFGHVDAGVLHVRPALDMKDPAQEKIAWEISDRVADLCHQYHGLLWGEHGKGVRSEYSPKFFGELYPQLQRIKSLFDPHNQLNPGKIATPDKSTQLLKINEVPTRGQYDRQIATESWDNFSEAVYCNGNGACFNWNTHDAMCPSWKATRKREDSPKGRASLVREWLRLLSNNDYTIDSKKFDSSIRTEINMFWRKLQNTRNARKGEEDFSHEVYASMATCLSCKSCTGQCPIKVDVPEFRSKFLSLYYTRYLRPLKDYLVGSLEFVLPFGARVPILYNFVVGASVTRWFFEKYIGFVDAPLISKASLSSANIEIASLKHLKTLSDIEKSKTILIVQDAFTRYFESPLIIDLVLFLRKLGYRPLLAPYKPNGKPLHVHGFISAFKRTANKNARQLKDFEDAGFSLIGVDPAMTLAIRSEYALHVDEPDKLPKVQLIQEWLSTQSEVLLTHRTEHELEYSLALHCTEKTNAAASNKQWKNIFELLGVKLNIIELGCCGMAGTFGHEAKNKGSSVKLFDMSWKEAVQNSSNENQLIASGYSCRSQVKRLEGSQIQHPVQALLKAMSHAVAE
ncbi:MAG: FAD/FMN-containing dehydrogenase/Fe-S oxidoreductase [Flavobacteriales bacterium]|jgi:FAD/FMN-containing dehydrogenase/Fe-S oxidoreductase